MSTDNSATRSSAGRIVTAIVLGGLIAGSLDLAFAYAYYGVSFQRILQSVAAGALGRDAAVGGGWNSALIGAACHYFISICAAAAFVIGSRIVPALVRYPLIGGVLFGIAMYFFMNAIVVPMSNAGRPFSWAFVTAYVPLLAHMFLFGLPIALITRQFAPR